MYTKNKQIKQLFKNIEELSAGKNSLIIAIDGRCASGKTTLASYLKEKFYCNIIPMDHFFLQPSMRTPQRLTQPGGNVDYERFLSDVLIPLTKGGSFYYQPYNCKNQSLDEAIKVTPTVITVIEGSYSCHPYLRDYYDLKIFLSTSPDKQCLRIKERNGEDGWKMFQEKWIPLEELYFNNLEISQECDIHITT